MSNHYLKSWGESKEIPRQDNVESLLNAVSMSYDNMPRYNFSLFNSRGQLLTETSDSSLITDEFNVAFKFPLVYSIGDNPEKIIKMHGNVFELVDGEDIHYETENYVHLTIHQWGGYPYIGKFSFYDKWRKLTILSTDDPLLTRVTSMKDCFNDIEVEIAPLSKGLSEWDVSNVTNMSCIFSFSKFNGDISKWDVSNVTNMECMFYNSNFNGDISKWNVSKVTDMNAMFYNLNFNGDISKWNVSNVTDMNYMFANSKFNGDISKWNISNVTDMSGIFSSSDFNGDISEWKLTPAQLEQLRVIAE